MQAISNAIREGAEAFMGSAIHFHRGIMAVVLAIAAFCAAIAVSLTSPRLWRARWSSASSSAPSCSGLSGYTGMFVSIRTNIRTANSCPLPAWAKRTEDSPSTAGAVTGMVVISLVAAWAWALLFFLFGGASRIPTHVPYQLVGFGFGASLVALFAQLGGGIYTKAADVGADLVGKVEAGIPEDDPTQPRGHC